MIDLRLARNRIFMFAYNLQDKKQFEGFMVACILINTLFLSLDRYPENPEETEVMEKINIVFTCIFTLEMIIKLLAIGFKNYFRSMFNVFDCLVVISGFIDIFLATFLVK
jgi:voltage-dependent calcium channel R type alpha-1E